jgi:hypothetical protein
MGGLHTNGSTLITSFGHHWLLNNFSLTILQSVYLAAIYVSLL